MEPQARTFSREEAEALLPDVDRLLGEAQALAEQLASAQQSAQAEHWKLRSNGKVRPEASGEAPEPARRSIARQVAQILERIQAMGIVVRDIRSGLIDFPSLRDGRIIHLCWRRGEPLEIRWWHEVDGGFRGRKPI